MVSISIVLRNSIEISIPSILCVVRVVPSPKMLAFWKENERKYYPSFRNET